VTQDPSSELRTLAANTIRALAIDATNAANSGHPGAPMGLADIAVVLWGEVMRFDPSAPDWADRDRFVLSNGHASMLLYAMLHLSGHALPLEELRRFRQLGSKTPGHPEYGVAPGVETTTGPLGQGFANGVGMALAARMLKARLNGRGGFSPISHQVFGICGDGCMMEGVTAEAASLAGHLGLGEIVYVYDDNKITIDGKTAIAFSEDVEKRFIGYGWHVLRVDGHDPAAVKEALLAGKAETARPSLIMARTHIGFGSPNRQDSEKAHGEPLGEEEGRLAKQRLGWQGGPFEVPDRVRAYFRAAADRGRAAHAAWEASLAEARRTSPELGTLFDAHLARPAGASPELLAHVLRAVESEKGATRAMSGKALNAIAEKLPALIGGSADLAVSNKSLIKGTGYVSKENAAGRNIAFGIREHAMGSIVNGLALSGGFVPFGATFLAFADYMRPPLRLSALMKIRSITVFTHESVYLGEDGPTHQPVEQLWALRLIPGYTVWRPADALETGMAWCYAALEGEPAPHALCCTRQNVATLERPAGFDPKLIWRGGYTLVERSSSELGIVATGSEVGLAVEAAARLESRGVRARVVSMPSVERFLAQDPAYRDAVLPPSLPLVSLELGRTGPWKAITGREGLNLGIDTFGESAPWEALRDHFGMTPDAVAARILAWRGRA
jgi:transketolase